MIPNARIEIVTVRDGEPFGLDWQDAVVSREPTEVYDETYDTYHAAHRLVVVRRGT